MGRGVGQYVLFRRIVRREALRPQGLSGQETRQRQSRARGLGHADAQRAAVRGAAVQPQHAVRVHRQVGSKAQTVPLGHDLNRPGGSARIDDRILHSIPSPRGQKNTRIHDT